MPESDQPGQPPQGGPEPVGLVQREIVLVIILAAVAAVAFGMTRSLAEWSEATADEAAAGWHARGTALVESGRANEGIALLRRAVSHDRLNAAFALSLVRALSDPAPNEAAMAEARRLLEQLREREPENPEINLRLARVLAAAGETDEAIRLYNHAMYGRSPGDEAYDRRRIRAELATFLLESGDRARALGELFALAPDVPDVPAEHLALGQLFLRAGEARTALTEFQTALRLEPSSWEAAAGAGDAALALGAFRQAERYLQDAVRRGASEPAVGDQLALVRRVRALNPLSPGLLSTVRVARIRAGLTWAAGRLQGCGLPAAPDDPVPELNRMARLPLAELRESDALTEAIGLVARAVDVMKTRCTARDPAEDAWAIIGAAALTPG